MNEMGGVKPGETMSLPIRHIKEIFMPATMEDSLQNTLKIDLCRLDFHPPFCQISLFSKSCWVIFIQFYCGIAPFIGFVTFKNTE